MLRPNELQNCKEFLKSVIRNNLSCGYCYLYPYAEDSTYTRRLDSIGKEKGAQIKVLNTDRITFNSTFLFGLITFNSKDGKFYYHNGNRKEEIAFTSIIPFWDSSQDIDNPMKGVSRLQSLEDEINNIIIAKRGKTNKLKQSGKFVLTPSTKSLSNGFGNQMDAPVSPMNPSYTHRQKLEDDLTEKGLTQEKAITVTKIEYDVLNVMQSIQDFSYDNEVENDARKIKNIFDIPKEFQNFKDSQTKFDNRIQAFGEFFDLSILPFATNFCESIYDFYTLKDGKRMSEYKDWRFILDYSQHPYYQHVENKKIEIKNETHREIREDVKAGILTIDEAKLKLEENGIYQF